MRILMLTYNLAGYGGSFLRAFQFARQMVECGQDVTLLAGRRQAGLGRLEKDWKGVRVIQVGDIFPARVRHAGLSLADIAGRLSHLWQGGYDIVHGFGHRFAVSLPALRSRASQGVPYIADWADLWGEEGIAGQRRAAMRWTLGVLDHYSERATYRRADHLTVITSDLADRARRLGIPDEKLFLLPIITDTEAIRPLPKETVRRRYGLPLDAPIVVHAGMAPYDVDLAAKSFVELARQNPKVILINTGAHPYEMVRIITEAGYNDRFLCLGYLPFETMAEILACGDVMLLPYRNNSLNRGRFPNRFGDYLAAGRPVVANPTGDLCRVMQANQVGLLVDETPQAMAAGMQALLEDGKLREEMGANARSLAETCFSGTALRSSLLSLYQRVTKS